MEKNKLIAIGCLIGASLEWYDFALFGLLLPHLSKIFFPPDCHFALLKTILLFSSAFITRPFGSLFWAYLANKYGQRLVLLASISAMTASTVAIGFIPGYDLLGSYSIVILLVCRLLQGFSVSGEHASILSYLHENAPKKSKPLYSSVGIIGVYLGIALGISACWLFSSTCSTSLIQSWRFAFIASAPLGFVAYFLRLKISSQKNSTSIKNSHTKSHIEFPGRKVLAGILVFQVAIVIPYTVFYYLFGLAKIHAYFPVNSLNLLTLLSSLFTATLISFFAKLSAHIKAAKLIQLGLIGTLIGAAMVYPLFFNESLVAYAFAQLYFCFFTALIVGPFCFFYASQFKTEFKFLAIALCFNLSSAYFGGFTPLIFSLFQLSSHASLFSELFLILSCSCALYALPFLSKLGAKDSRIKNEHTATPFLSNYY